LTLVFLKVSVNTKRIISIGFFMSESELPIDIFDELDKEIPLFDDSNVNQRMAVRYRRNDIKAVVKLGKLILPQLVPVIIEDISSKGAGIKTTKKFGRNKQVYLYLLFQDGKRFDIEAIVVYTATNKYGLKFKSYNKPLGDHILKTQTDLIFG
jgi:hypothetical protein